MTVDQSNLAQQLKLIRTSRSLTQRQFGAAVGISQRMIAYYETQGGQPSVRALVKIANALNISTDELLGREEIIPKSKNTKLMKRLARARYLPQADQRALLQHLDVLLTARSIED